MKPRTLLVLLVLVLGLGTFIWFYERNLPSSEERTELGKKVFELEKEDVTGVTIESSKGPVRLERKDGKAGKDAEAAVEWNLVKPMATRADTFAVDRLLEALASLEKTRTLDEVDPKAVGLDKPRATVRLTTKEGDKVLKLGAEVPTGGSLIAGLEGEEGAYVVPDSILAELEKAPVDWRDRLMFHGDREAIQRIVMTGGAEGPVVLVKRPAGFWMEKPVSDRADRDLVDGLLSDLTGLTADRFVEASKFTAARQVVEVSFAGGPPPVRIELGEPVATAEGNEPPAEGQPSGEVSLARVGDTVFEVRTRLGESAQRSAAEWRAVQLSALQVHDVEAATVRDEKGSLDLARAGTDWKRSGTTISYLPVGDLLFSVTGARAERLLSRTEARLAAPLLTFELKSKGMGNETLTLYPPAPEGVPARVSGRDVVLLLPANALQEIRKGIQAVRDAKPVTAAAAATGK
ncbi:MAG: DUF4340 domain-containing protein [Thermoanaerobaculia bacterium]